MIEPLTLVGVIAMITVITGLTGTSQEATRSVTASGPTVGP
jgi:hypothetical protein